MEFLTQAQALAEEILLLTSRLKLTGQPAQAEQEVDAYVKLIETREPMVAKLTQLLKQDTSGDKARKAGIDKITLKISMLDKEHKRVMEHLRKSVMGSLKESRSGQRLSQAYAHPYEGQSSGILDAKQ